MQNTLYSRLREIRLFLCLSKSLRVESMNYYFKSPPPKFQPQIRSKIAHSINKVKQGFHRFIWRIKKLLRVRFLRYFFCRKNFFKHIFFSIGHQRPTNGEYIGGEKKFFGHSWRPGEPSENSPIKHRENTFMSIKIDRVIRFCSTFF